METIDRHHLLNHKTPYIGQLSTDFDDIWTTDRKQYVQHKNYRIRKRKLLDGNKMVTAAAKFAEPQNAVYRPIFMKFETVTESHAHEN